MSAFIVLLASCQQWGEVDPPAGNQVYPKLEQVASFPFNEEDLNSDIFQVFSYEGGELPAIIEEEGQGKVLRLSSGYLCLLNPLNAIKVQNGVSLTFWYKQVSATSDKEGGTGGVDLFRAIFSFQNEKQTQKLFFTSNAWIGYKNDSDFFEDNNPNSNKTGLIVPNSWHYVAMAVTNKGYFVCVDGVEKIRKEIAEFDFSKIVSFMASAPFLYIGHGTTDCSTEFHLNDLKIYRNVITEKEVAIP